MQSKMLIALFMTFLKMYLFYLDALAAPGVAPLCTTHPLVAPPLVPVTRGILPLVEWVAAPTAAGQLAAPHLPPACHLTPAWVQS